MIGLVGCVCVLSFCTLASVHLWFNCDSLGGDLSCNGSGLMQMCAWYGGSWCSCSSNVVQLWFIVGQIAVIQSYMVELWFSIGFVMCRYIYIYTGFNCGSALMSRYRW